MESGSRGCSIGGGEESELGGASFHLQSLQVTRETLSSRAGAAVFYTNFSSIWRPRFGIWSVNWLTWLFCDQDGGTPLDSDLDQGAGEEANSPAGGARGDGGDVVGGVHFHQHQDCDCKHFDI